MSDNGPPEPVREWRGFMSSMLSIGASTLLWLNDNRIQVSTKEDRCNTCNGTLTTSINPSDKKCSCNVVSDEPLDNNCYDCELSAASDPNVENGETSGELEDPSYSEFPDQNQPHNDIEEQTSTPIIEEPITPTPSVHEEDTEYGQYEDQTNIESTLKPVVSQQSSPKISRIPRPLSRHSRDVQVLYDTTLEQIGAKSSVKLNANLPASLKSFTKKIIDNSSERRSRHKRFSKIPLNVCPNGPQESNENFVDSVENCKIWSTATEWAYASSVDTACCTSSENVEVKSEGNTGNTNLKIKAGNHVIYAKQDDLAVPRPKYKSNSYSKLQTNNGTPIALRSQPGISRPGSRQK